MKIKSTFLHLKGFGKKTEQRLWEKGVLDWEHYNTLEQQDNLFYNGFATILEDSFVAYKKKDVDFFAQTLPRNEYCRLALSFPEDVLFLDIETTGLSSYYDYVTVIGWSIKNEYGYYIHGLNDITHFQEVLNKAKILVTFNGSIFDIPFLKTHFRELAFPRCHIDLRFLAKSNGLEGGQKQIEQIIGFKRPKSLQETSGFAATLLWDEYKWGKKTSLEKLVKYNHSDIEGMKAIFDYCIKNMYKKNKLSKFFEKPFEFKRYKSNLNRVELKSFIKAKNIPFDKKATLKYESIAKKINRDTKIVGIDLTGSETKPSGVAFLHNNKASTYLMKSDEEMIDEILRFSPHIVSIDSPLSLPYGRLSVFDDDPARNEFGIMRQCERILKKRGVNAYPTLLPSMQKLTKRGIGLAAKLRSRGIPTIESYPGVVQDIIGLPRKQASLSLLKKGLGIFGLKGEFLKKEVSHDEIDAITSAIVGIFFLSKDYEAIGDMRENLMIIPDLNANKIPKKIYGLSGVIASGKTTAAKFLEEQDFYYTRYSSVLEDILYKKNKEVTRESLQKLGDEMSKNQIELSKMLYDKMYNKRCVVIDGLRHPEDYTFFFEMYGLDFELIFIDVDQNIAEQRYITKYNSDNYKEVIQRDTERKIQSLKKFAVHTIENNRTLKEFENKILNITKRT